MRKLCVCVCLFCSLVIVAQTDDGVNNKKQVSHRVEKVIEYDSGLDKERLVEEKSYDKEGRVVEFKDWNKDGKIKQWIKYSYNADGTVATEVTLDTKGKIVEKVVYEYRDGFKYKKSYYDNKDRLVKEKIYEYSFY